MAHPEAHDSDRIFRRHQELMTLFSASDRRGNSVTSSTGPFNDHHVSQNDLAVLKEKFQFIRDDATDAEQGETDWQIRMSVRYYRQLFREYALADLSRYKEGRIGLRWRTEREVVAGKGQFSCGNKRCDERTGLHSYELLFAYVEHGKRKRCLVKVRVCSGCAEKLFYKKLEEIRRKKALKMEKREWKRRQEGVGGTLNRIKKKRRRNSVSHSDSQSNDESVCDNTEERQEEPNNDVVASRKIHEMCSKINAEERAAYSREELRPLNQHSDAFNELLL